MRLWPVLCRVVNRLPAAFKDLNAVKDKALMPLTNLLRERFGNCLVKRLTSEFIFLYP